MLDISDVAIEKPKAEAAELALRKRYQQPIEEEESKDRAAQRALPFNPDHVKKSVPEVEIVMDLFEEEFERKHPDLTFEWYRVVVNVSDMKTPSPDSGETAIGYLALSNGQRPQRGGARLVETADVVEKGCYIFIRVKER